ncbi:MAG: DUF1911 domain-containing protein [Zoogloeaceae bacterium]|nr:DUF1911 domain-containing protein [Zoogloeaceae bacterium]
MANDFYGKRRERFLNEEPALQYRNDLIFLINSSLDFIDNGRYNKEEHREDAWALSNWEIGNDKFDLLVLDYSEGRPIAEIAKDFPELLNWNERCSLPHPQYKTIPFYLAETDSYDYFLSLLSLAKLLRNDKQIARYVALLDVKREGNRGRDELFEILLQRLGVPSVPTRKRLEHKAHWILLEAIQSAPENRPKLMQEFLKKWYACMRGCAWYGLHTKRPDRFRGYWCFEAGLVTCLWQIDDSSYRDLPFYPKDLVDWARGNGVAGCD